VRRPNRVSDTKSGSVHDGQHPSKVCGNTDKGILAYSAELATVRLACARSAATGSQPPARRSLRPS